ncbi:hypothetical protein IE994_16640 [Enterobacter hormaechei]|uniref:Uncharacterized protein n=1 Tax=Enterobacter hormaechei TaxID=158836 RepID=A0A927DKW5_9ENTR|nr:hypothetical protein [Enterobacter hormaechei]MBD3706712.1 hypothetical protein [Enterobacter hormaechei]MBD3717253.1 hypothetical protein [Enterobacter hormaechei]
MITSMPSMMTILSPLRVIIGLAMDVPEQFFIYNRGESGLKKLTKNQTDWVKK